MTSPGSHLARRPAPPPRSAPSRGGEAGFARRLPGLGRLLAFRDEVRSRLLEARALEAIPSGPVLLVANHGSHVLAWDGAMIVTACLLEAEPPRLVHGMGDHRLM